MKEDFKPDEFFRMLVDLSPDGYFIFNYEGIISYVSRQIFQKFAIEDKSEIIGSSILNWVDQEQHQVLMEMINTILSEQHYTDKLECLMHKKNGTSFWAELASSPIPAADGTTGILVVCHDISARKKISDELMIQRNRAEESDKLKTAFIQNISHEIRTPMNAIVGFSAMLGDPDLDSNTRDTYVDVIMNSSNHLLEILSDIIDIANIEAHLVKLNPQSVNINSVLKSIHRQFISKAEEKALEFTVMLPLKDEEAELITDNTKLHQVLSNLVNNAIKFTEKGSVKFGYYVKKDFIEFFVKDTGIGIPAEQLLKIFDRFYQIEDHVSKKFEGTGLGLSITKAYVELLGGRIDLLSSPDNGSTFFFMLPLKKPDVKEFVKEESRLVFRFPVRRKILVAEDVESNFKLINFFLANCNAEVVHAPDGKVAVDIINSDPGIDLVLMDLKMPVLNGLEATKIIRASRPDLPVIAVTAYTDDRVKAMEAGCSSFIAKPFDKRRLIQVLKEFI